MEHDISAAPRVAPGNIKRKPVSSDTVSNLSSSVLSQNEPIEPSHHLSKYEPIASTEPAADDGEPITLQANEMAKSRSRWHQPLTIWRWELVSALLSIAAFISIIIVLRVFQNKDIHQWKAPISINAIIAILSAIFKAALALPLSEGISQLKWIWFSRQPRNLVDLNMYDRASRGIWGCVVFIVTFVHKLKLSPLAAYGALLLLLTVAVDPFSQASVSTQNCIREDSIPNLVPRALNYSEDYSLPQPNSISEGFNPSLGMQLAVLLGLSQPPATSSKGVQPNIKCPTANCTVSNAQDGVFTTLSMCHKCLDVTQQLKRTTGIRKVAAEDGTPGIDNWVKYTYTPVKGIDTSLTLHSNFDGHIGRDNPSNQPLAPLAVSCLNSSFASTISNFRDGPWDQTALTSFQGILSANISDSCRNSEYTECDENIFAFDCALQPCAKAYKAKVSKGEYQEEEVASWLLHSVNTFENVLDEDKSTSWLRFQLGLNQTYVNGTLRECNPLPYKTATHTVPIDMPQNQNVHFQYRRQVLYYPEECVFGLDGGYSLKSMQDYLHDQMNNVTLYHSGGSKYLGEPWLKILYNDSNLDLSSVNKFMDGLATSMGVFMRTAGTQSDLQEHVLSGRSQFAPGHAQSEHTCIRVHWKFLSFPALLLVAGLVFFGALVFLNWRSPWDGNWKSSTLPLLFQDVPVKWPENGSRSSLADERQLNQMVKHVQAKLIQDDDDNGRWKLTTMQDTKEI